MRATDFTSPLPVTSLISPLADRDQGIGFALDLRPHGLEQAFCDRGRKRHDAVFVADHDIARRDDQTAISGIPTAGRPQLIVLLSK